MPERETGVAGGLEAEAVIDSVIRAGAPRSIVDTMMSNVPSRFQQNEEAQGMIDAMRATERQYLPLMADLQASSTGNDVQRNLPKMMAGLFIVGLIACLSLAAGAIAFLVAAILFILYLAVRWRVVQDLRREARLLRDDLIRQWTRLVALERRLIEQEKIG